MRFTLSRNQLGIVATTSRRMSTIRFALTSRRIRLWADEAILELRRQVRKLPEQCGGKRRQGKRGRIDGVDVDLHVFRQLHDDRPARVGAARREIILHDLDEVGLVLGSEDVADLRAGAQRLNHLGERRFALGNLRGVVGPLQVRDLGLGFVVDLEVGLDAVLEFERRAALRVDGGLAGRRGRGDGCRCGRARERGLLSGHHWFLPGGFGRLSLPCRRIQRFGRGALAGRERRRRKEDDRRRLENGHSMGSYFKACASECTTISCGRAGAWA